jgi:hypothetical protein
MTSLTFGKDKIDISNGLSALGIMLSFLILIMTFYISADQQKIAIKLSLLESQLENERNKKNHHERERQRFEASIDKFYLPLFNLLSCHEGEAANLIKLNEINCHRHLAKDSVFSQFVVFRKAYLKTKQFPVEKSEELLNTVNHDLNSINCELIRIYSEISE